MSRSLVNIKNMQSAICAGMGDSVGKYEFTIGRHLLSGWREINLYLNHDLEVQTAVLEFDNVVSLPCDFVYVTKVGVLHNGRLAVLSLDKNVRKEKLNQTQAEERLRNIFYGEYGGDGCYFYNCFRNGNYLGEMYGFGRGMLCDGFYNIDTKAGEIYIGSLFPKDAEIVVEYKSDGISEGLQLIPSQYELCLSYWAKARFYEERGDINKAIYNNAEYERHYNKIKRLNNYVNPLYAAAKLNQSFSQTNY